MMNGERVSYWKLGLLLIALVGLAVEQPMAQAIVAPGGRTLFSGATLVRSFVDVSRLSFQSENPPREMTRYITPLALVYGIYPKWSLIAAQPYITLDLDDRSGSQRSSGLGDLQFFLQYDGLYSRNSPGGLTRLAGTFGVRVPSGGSRFSTDALAYTAGLVFETQADLKYVFTADVEYTFETETSSGIDAGDRIQFDAVPGYFVISRGGAPSDAGWLRRLYQDIFRNGAYLLLELNGSWQARARHGRAPMANSGGTLFWLSPGIQYFPSRSLLLEFSAPIPVVKSLNGVQAEPDSRFLFGFRYLF